MQKSFAVMQKGDYRNRTAKRRDVQKPVQMIVQKNGRDAETVCRNDLQKWLAETVQNLAPIGCAEKKWQRGKCICSRNAERGIVIVRI